MAMAGILLGVSLLCVYGRLTSAQGCPGMGSPITSKITINNVSGAQTNPLTCGKWPDPWSQDFAAVSASCFDADPDICKKCAKVTGPTGTTLELPIADKCPGCTDGHVDVSPSAALKLGGPEMCCTTNVNGTPTQSQYCPTGEAGKYKIEIVPCSSPKDLPNGPWCPQSPRSDNQDNSPSGSCKKVDLKTNVAGCDSDKPIQQPGSM